MPTKEKPSFEPKPFGRYVLMDKLAIGGMAEIYKAKTYGVDGFEKVLAVKRILPHCAADPEFINMLVDEAKLTVLLSHANIVQVFDLGKVGDDYFISMEYIYGTNLREFMTRYSEHHEKIPQDTVVYIMSEICKGLDYAHRKTDSQGRPLNIVHRDISPHNILISYEGEVKIVDFGIAKAAMNVSHTMAGILKGKIAYMSPEQALGKPIDHRTDIFSAGIVLYELLTGEKLFTGETQFEILNKIRTTRINTTMMPDEIPAPLKAIIVKALAYNTKDRYQSAGDFQLDLTKHLYSSYVDFSPRQLSAILTKLFPSEMKKREDPSIAPANEKTRSVMVQQTEREDVVAQGTVKIDEPALDLPRASEVTHDTAVSGVVALPEVKKNPQKIVGFLVAIVLVLGVSGYFVSHFLNKRPSSPQTQQPPVAVVPPPSVVPQVEIPVKPPEPPSGEEFGSIEVNTQPAGAKIILNGADTNQVTPATLSKLALGDEYELKLSKEHYKEITKSLPLTSSKPVTISENLEALPLGMIDVDSVPAGANIFIDGKDTGKVTPSKIDNLELPRNYTVTLKLANYGDWQSVVDLKDFNPVSIKSNLTELPKAVVTPPPVAVVPPPSVVTPPVEVPPPVVSPPKPTVEVPPTPSFGSLKIASEPKGARILLNGKDTGKTTPDLLEKLDLGKIKVTLVKEGFEDWKNTVSIAANKKSELSASLKEIPKPVAVVPPPVEIPTPPVAVTPPPPVSEPPPPNLNLKEKGSIILYSVPEGATIIVDGNNFFTAKGAKKIQIQGSHGPHNIKIVLKGYHDWEKTADLTAVNERSYEVQLEKK